MIEFKHEFETKYGEYINGKYRNVLICKHCKEKWYVYLPEFNKIINY